MVNQTTTANTQLPATIKDYSNYKKATSYLSDIIPETKRWVEEGVINLQPDELEVYLKFVVTPSLGREKTNLGTLKDLLDMSLCNTKIS